MSNKSNYQCDPFCANRLHHNAFSGLYPVASGLFRVQSAARWRVLLVDKTDIGSLTEELVATQFLISFHLLRLSWGGMELLTPRAFAVGAFLLALAACGQSSGDQSSESDTFKSASLSKGKLPSSCEGGGIATGEEIAVSERIELRSEPNNGASVLVNEKATRILGRTEFIYLDQTERLKELCRQAEWSKVQVVEPEWLTDNIGWVPVSALRQIERDHAGKRQFVETDFIWDEDTERFKSQLIRAVNRISRENANCESVDTGTLSLSPTKGTPANPIFFVTCNNERGPFNVWFGPEEASDESVSFAAIKNIGEGEAIVACEKSAKAAANNPQTVKFSAFMDVSFVPYPNGNSRLLSTFRAKNSFGVESKFRILCFFEGPDLTELGIEPAVD